LCFASSKGFVNFGAEQIIENPDLLRRWCTNNPFHFSSDRQLFDVFCRWFCHFDDDNYVNIPKLLSTLGKYSPQEDWYLGKPSIRTPLEILDREKKKYGTSRVSNYYYLDFGKSLKKAFQ